MESFAVIMFVLGSIVFALAALLAAGMMITFVAEREWRAAAFTVLFFAPLLAGIGVAAFIDYPGRSWVILAVVVFSVIIALALLLPFGRNLPLKVTGEQERVDERDALFHRFYRIEEGTPEFEEYYRGHPDRKEKDDEIRALPPLAAPGAKTYDRLSSPFQAAAFGVLEEITRGIEWEPQPIEGKPVEAAPEEFALRVKGFAKYLGADLIGCTELNPAYVYSHIGRSPGKWGDGINLNHTHAVAIAVEMSHEMLRHAPGSATTTETAFRYFEAAKIAMLLARYINLLGYEARAHVDGNYRVMCVPVAADAGLGELGRLGLLVTPEFGPRIKLSVVTTNMPLAGDEPIVFGVQDFCAFCKKCATCCPSGSVDKGDKREYNGAVKWKSEQDSCYRYWRVCGSDCAVCVKVCPYSKPRTAVHNLVRWVITRNPLARRLALIGDDIFYGRRPKTKYPLPDWHRRRTGKDS